ncbi:unnamed protein product [Larinioides sclopetarius]|uniref:Uncharacterized protein n=1 Tax=Larinioides sclopetarius TaxID=280406 RepID=A0AAV1Z5U3_9ARAC
MAARRSIHSSIRFSCDVTSHHIFIFKDVIIKMQRCRIHFVDDCTSRSGVRIRLLGGSVFPTGR